MNTTIYEKPLAGYGFIYILTLPSGKSYVGQTIQTVRCRFNRHARDKNCHYLYNAIQKYGRNNVEIKILGTFQVNELDAQEIKFIKELGTAAPDGYNLHLGGQCRRIFSEATKLKLSEMAKRRPPVSLETRKKLSEAGKRRAPQSAETIAKRANTQRGHKRSPEIVARMSEAARRSSHVTDVTRAKLSAAGKGRKHSTETRMKLKLGWAKRRKMLEQVKNGNNQQLELALL